jgi:hypothetical protein
MAMIERLQGLGLQSLALPMLSLIERTRRMASVLDDDEEQSDRLLLQHLDRCANLGQDDARLLLMQVCVGLPAFRYRAGAACSAEVWHPLKETLEQFETRQGELLFWLDGELRPSISETQEWLRAWGF